MRTYCAFLGLQLLGDLHFLPVGLVTLVLAKDRVCEVGRVGWGDDAPTEYEYQVLIPEP